MFSFRIASDDDAPTKSSLANILSAVTLAVDEPPLSDNTIPPDPPTCTNSLKCPSPHFSESDPKSLVEPSGKKLELDTAFAQCRINLSDPLPNLIDAPDVAALKFVVSVTFKLAAPNVAAVNVVSYGNEAEPVITKLAAFT